MRRSYRRPEGLATAFVALSLAACRPDVSSDAPVAPEETVEGAPVVSSATQAIEGIHYGGPYPPPAPHEDRGPPPSPDHFWAPGYQRWNGHDHVWHPGGWYPRREGLEYIAPHWEEVYGRWEYHPGVWVRR